MTDAGGSVRRSRRPRGEPAPKGFTDEAVLSDEEVVRRVDLREAAHDDAPLEPWIGGAADAPTIDDAATQSSNVTRARSSRSRKAAAAGSATATVATVAPVAASDTPVLEAVRRTRQSADERRRQLWRDSATILIGVVLALLVGQTLIPANTAGPGASDTPLPSTIAIGSAVPPVSLPPGVTFGPIINPSLGVDASPTPIPVITMGPTPSPSPSPSPSIKPTLKPTPKPTVKPTPKPTIKPTVAPTEPGPTPTPAPPPDASFSTDITLLTVHFNNTSTGATAWHWDFGNGAISNAREPTYTYAVPNTYSVTLTVSGPGGPDSSITHDVTVPPPP